MIDLVALWVALFGMWPFADPGHSFDTALSVVDVVLHWVAFGVLAWRWKIERRRHRYVIRWTTPAGQSTVTMTDRDSAEMLLASVLESDRHAYVERVWS